MLDYIVINLETGKEELQTAKSLQEIYSKEENNIRAYPVELVPCALYIAKKIAEKTVETQCTETQKSIEKALRVVWGKVNNYIRIEDSKKQTGKTLDEFIISCFADTYTHCQDYFQQAYEGLFMQETVNIDSVRLAMKWLNRYITGERTAHEREVLTAYDLETEEPINNELRRLTVGLTEKEERDGKTSKQTETAKAILEVSEKLTPIQKKVWYYLAKVDKYKLLSNREVARRLNCTEGNIRKHKKYIGKKLLQSDVIAKHVKL